MDYTRPVRKALILEAIVSGNVVRLGAAVTGGVVAIQPTFDFDIAQGTLAIDAIRRQLDFFSVPDFDEDKRYWLVAMVKKPSAGQLREFVTEIESRFNATCEFHVNDHARNREEWIARVRGTAS